MVRKAKRKQHKGKTMVRHLEMAKQIAMPPFRNRGPALPKFSAIPSRLCPGSTQLHLWLKTPVSALWVDGLDKTSGDRLCGFGLKLVLSFSTIIEELLK